MPKRASPVSTAETPRRCEREDGNVLPFVFRTSGSACCDQVASCRDPVASMRRSVLPLVLAAAPGLSRSGDRRKSLRAACSTCRRVVIATVAVLVLVHALRIFVLTDEQDVQFLLDLRLHPGALRHRSRRQRRVSRRLRRRSVDLLHLRLHSRRSDASRPQPRLADAVRHGAGAPLRAVALHAFHAGDGGGRCAGASRQSLRARWSR